MNVANTLYLPFPVGSRIHITLQRQRKAEKERDRARAREGETESFRDVLKREIVETPPVIMQGCIISPETPLCEITSLPRFSIHVLCLTRRIRGQTVSNVKTCSLHQSESEGKDRSEPSAPNLPRRHLSYPATCSSHAPSPPLRSARGDIFS